MFRENAFKNIGLETCNLMYPTYKIVLGANSVSSPRIVLLEANKLGIWSSSSLESICSKNEVNAKIVNLNFTTKDWDIFMIPNEFSPHFPYFKAILVFRCFQPVDPLNCTLYIVHCTLYKLHSSSPLSTAPHQGRDLNAIHTIPHIFRFSALNRIFFIFRIKSHILLKTAYFYTIPCSPHIFA